MTEPRRNSIEGKIQLYADSRLIRPDPPDHLDLPQDALPFWRAIMDARPVRSWAETDLVLAWQLACVMADIKAKKLSLERSPYRASLTRWNADQRRIDLNRLIMLQLRLLRALKIVKCAPRGRPPEARKSVFEVLMGEAD
jgi:hypothetical protein